MPPHSDSTLVRPYFLERKTGFEPRPHLGKKKVAEPVHRILKSLACRRVHPVSINSTGFAPGVERSTTSGILDEHPSVEDRSIRATRELTARFDAQR